MSEIKGNEYTLSKIFSSDFDFVIPPYQRPYAWTEKESEELFDDLYSFWQKSSSDEQYFLGSIVLNKKENLPRSEVIDGQQRITTLTILFSALASEFQAGTKDRDDIAYYINEPGHGVTTVTHPRLTIREKDSRFFKQYIQDMDFDGLLQLDPAKQDTEAKSNIIRNAGLLRRKVRENLTSPGQIRDFVVFLVTRCFIVAVSTSSQETAFRVFSVLNSRGMDLLPTDILKSELIGAITDAKEQGDYTELWEDTENDIGRSNFIDFFSALRMLYVKAKARQNIIDELKEKILPDITDAKARAFIDDVLVPYAEAYNFIKKPDNSEYLKWLNMLDNSDWIPAAMLYYAKNKNDSAGLEAFFRKLERLAAYMLVCSYGVNNRIARYAKILAELEASGGQTCGSIDLTDSEKKAFAGTLNADVYIMSSQQKKYIIMRLDSFVASVGAKYDSTVLSIEHILPQTVDAGSYWAVKWPDVQEREKWLHKIGNLIPLNRRKNSAARNFDFTTKKNAYFFKNGATPYVLANQIMSLNDWTPADAEKRQASLIEVFKQNWEL